jgi:hypothetical protein
VIKLNYLGNDGVKDTSDIRSNIDFVDHFSPYKELRKTFNSAAKEILEEGKYEHLTTKKSKKDVSSIDALVDEKFKPIISPRSEVLSYSCCERTSGFHLGGNEMLLTLNGLIYNGKFHLRDEKNYVVRTGNYFSGIVRVAFQSIIDEMDPDIKKLILKEDYKGATKILLDHLNLYVQYLKHESTKGRKIF